MESATPHRRPTASPQTSAGRTTPPTVATSLRHTFGQERATNNSSFSSSSKKPFRRTSPAAPILVLTDASVGIGEDAINSSVGGYVPEGPATVALVGRARATPEALRLPQAHAWLAPRSNNVDDDVKDKTNRGCGAKDCGLEEEEGCIIVSDHLPPFPTTTKDEWQSDRCKQSSGGGSSEPPPDAAPTPQSGGRQRTKAPHTKRLVVVVAAFAVLLAAALLLFGGGTRTEVVNHRVHHSPSSSSSPPPSVDAAGGSQSDSDTKPQQNNQNMASNQNAENDVKYHTITPLTDAEVAERLLRPDLSDFEAEGSERTGGGSSTPRIRIAPAHPFLAGACGEGSQTDVTNSPPLPRVVFEELPNESRMVLGTRCGDPSDPLRALILLKSPSDLRRQAELSLSAEAVMSYGVSSAIVTFAAIATEDVAAAEAAQSEAVVLIHYEVHRYTRHGTLPAVALRGELALSVRRRPAEDSFLSSSADGSKIGDKSSVLSSNSLLAGLDYDAFAERLAVAAERQQGAPVTTRAHHPPLAALLKRPPHAVLQFPAAATNGLFSSQNLRALCYFEPVLNHEAEATAAYPLQGEVEVAGPSADTARSPRRLPLGFVLLSDPHLRHTYKKDYTEYNRALLASSTAEVAIVSSCQPPFTLLSRQLDGRHIGRGGDVTMRGQYFFARLWGTDSNPKQQQQPNQPKDRPLVAFVPLFMGVHAEAIIYESMHNAVSNDGGDEGDDASAVPVASLERHFTEAGREAIFSLVRRPLGPRCSPDELADPTRVVSHIPFYVAGYKPATDGWEWEATNGANDDDTGADFPEVRAAKRKKRARTMRRRRLNSFLVLLRNLKSTARMTAFSDIIVTTNLPSRALMRGLWEACSFLKRRGGENVTAHEADATATASECATSGSKGHCGAGVSPRQMALLAYMISPSYIDAASFSTATLAAHRNQFVVVTFSEDKQGAGGAYYTGLSQWAVLSAKGLYDLARYTEEDVRITRDQFALYCATLPLLEKDDVYLNFLRYSLSSESFDPTSLVRSLSASQSDSYASSSSSSSDGNSNAQQRRGGSNAYLKYHPLLLRYGYGGGNGSSSEISRDASSSSSSSDAETERGVEAYLSDASFLAYPPRLRQEGRDALLRYYAEAVGSAETAFVPPRPILIDLDGDTLKWQWRHEVRSLRVSPVGDFSGSGNASRNQNSKINHNNFEVAMSRVGECSPTASAASGRAVPFSIFDPSLTAIAGCYTLASPFHPIWRRPSVYNAMYIVPDARLLTIDARRPPWRRPSKPRGRTVGGGGRNGAEGGEDEASLAGKSRREVRRIREEWARKAAEMAAQKKIDEERADAAVDGGEAAVEQRRSASLSLSLSSTRASGEEGLPREETAYFESPYASYARGVVLLTTVDPAVLGRLVLADAIALPAPIGDGGNAAFFNRPPQCMYVSPSSPAEEIRRAASAEPFYTLHRLGAVRHGEFDLSMLSKAPKGGSRTGSLLRGRSEVSPLSGREDTEPPLMPIFRIPRA